MARSAFALTCAILGVSSALEITVPSEETTFIADRLYTVKWDGTGDGRFEIDLYYCGSLCFEGDCGEWVSSLCPYGEIGCPDTAGDYDVTMPEPMAGTEGFGYKIRVMDVEDEESVDCSDAFTLLASEEPEVEGGVDGIVVTSPMEGDMAAACIEYTVEWDYDDGFGSKVGRFAIDLYEADGSGDCGTYYANICDKESIGCKDTQGDYDIAIPCGTDYGEYKIRVGVFGDDSTFGCSGAFTVFSEDGTEMTESTELSMSFLFT